MPRSKTALPGAVFVLLLAGSAAAAPAGRGAGVDLKPLARCYATYFAASMAAQDAGRRDIPSDELMSRIDKFVAGRLPSAAWMKMWRAQINEMVQSPGFSSDPDGYVRSTMRTCVETLSHYPQIM